jgi:hypothetical protein
VIERLVRLRGGLAKIFEERLEFLTRGIQVFESGPDFGTVLFNEPARIRECGGNIRRDGLFHFRRSIVQAVKQLLDLGL